MNRSGHFLTSVEDTAVSAEDAVLEVIDSVSVSFPFFDFFTCDTTTPFECRRARLLAKCFSFFEEGILRLDICASTVTLQQEVTELITMDSTAGSDPIVLYMAVNCNEKVDFELVLSATAM